MRENEKFNSEIRMAYNILHEIDPKLECVIFTDEYRDFSKEGELRLCNYVLPGTKYVRLLKLIDEEDDECLYVSIDNDVTVDEYKFKKYI